ncbi:MAG: OmpA family protein [Bacteroidetes bacterium]|nr:OmpA family protein [Bacteroidota bacterium]
MKLTNWTILLIPLLISVHSYGQDTVSIYFRLGSSKILDAQRETLNAITVKFDLSELDSVNYIGMADSVGDLKSNFRLAEKRARNVAKYCKKLLPAKIPSRSMSLGESTERNDNAQNRRVDIVLFFPTEEEVVVEEIEGCYYIDYALLHRSHVRTVTKGKKEWIIIETDEADLKKSKEHYTATMTKGGEVRTKKVNWSKWFNGKGWYSNTRYIAKILKKDFDAFKIFKIEEPPCNECNEAFPSEIEITKEDTCVQVDRFLMHNILFKYMPFSFRSVKIRAPRKYVVIDDQYYIGCGLERELVWTTKRGRRKRNYYYSRLPIEFGYTIANITRVMDCCESDPEPSECDVPMIDIRSTPWEGEPLNLNVEIGSHYQQSTITPYVGIAISAEGLSSRAALLVGTDVDLSFISSLRYQLTYLSFPLNRLNPISGWQNPKKIGSGKFDRFYLGAELKIKINETQQSYLEQNIHLGLAISNIQNGPSISRIFIQYGIGFDYLGNNSSGVYSIAQLGMNIKIRDINIQRRSSR